MPKRKSAAQIATADGTGGMVALEDNRFADGPWAVSFEIPATQADVWMEYLYAECDERGWSWTTFGQMEADENSQSITVRTGVPGQAPEITIIWERTQVGPLRVRARITGDPQPAQGLAIEFFDQVNERFQAGAKQRFYRKGYLEYEGLPWRGELWLEDELRLGPPARHAEFLIAPQIITVDAVVRAITWRGANALFESKLEEVSRFLAAVMRRSVHAPQGGNAWVFDKEKRHSEVRQLAYVEENIPSEMPKQGEHAPAPLRAIARPDLTWGGIMLSDDEQYLPDDIHDLWRRYVDLAPERQDQFQRVAGILRSARMLWRENKTMSLALKVVACEALKPAGRRYDRLNVYDVVEGLLGEPHARALRGLRFPPQKVRSKHLHRGEVLDSEGIHRLMLSTFRDPTFDEEYRIISQIADAALIEWLRACGTFTAPARRQSRLQRLSHFFLKVLNAVRGTRRERTGGPR